MTVEWVSEVALGLMVVNDVASFVLSSLEQDNSKSPVAVARPIDIVGHLGGEMSQ